MTMNEKETSITKNAALNITDAIRFELLNLNEEQTKLFLEIIENNIASRQKQFRRWEWVKRN